MPDTDAPRDYDLLARLAAALNNARLDATLRVLDDEVARRIRADTHTLRIELQQERRTVASLRRELDEIRSLNPRRGK